MAPWRLWSYVIFIAGMTIVFYCLLSLKCSGVGNKSYWSRFAINVVICNGFFSSSRVAVTVLRYDCGSPFECSFSNVTQVTGFVRPRVSSHILLESIPVVNNDLSTALILSNHMCLKIASSCSNCRGCRPIRTVYIHFVDLLILSFFHNFDLALLITFSICFSPSAVFGKLILLLGLFSFFSLSSGLYKTHPVHSFVSLYPFRSLTNIILFMPHICGGYFLSTEFLWMIVFFFFLNFFTLSYL